MAGSSSRMEGDKKRSLAAGSPKSAPHGARFFRFIRATETPGSRDATQLDDSSSGNEPSRRFSPSFFHSSCLFRPPLRDPDRTKAYLLRRGAHDRTRVHCRGECRASSLVSVVVSSRIRPFANAVVVRAEPRRRNFRAKRRVQFNMGANLRSLDRVGGLLGTDARCIGVIQTSLLCDPTRLLNAHGALDSHLTAAAYTDDALEYTYVASWYSSSYAPVLSPCNTELDSAERYPIISFASRLATRRASKPQYDRSGLPKIHTDLPPFDSQ